LSLRCPPTGEYLSEVAVERRGGSPQDPSDGGQHAGGTPVGIASGAISRRDHLLQFAQGRRARPSHRCRREGRDGDEPAVTLIGTFQGNAHAFQSPLANEPILIAAALVVVYVILGMLYESYSHPLTILSTLPSAGIGALLGLMIGGFDLSVIGIIGIILLIGIVKKNGIMLVDFAIHRERDGDSPQTAIREACLLRFRPILMTTMAAMLGDVPLMLGHGAGRSFASRWAMPWWAASRSPSCSRSTPHRSSTSISTGCSSGSRARGRSGGKIGSRPQSNLERGA
jgi:hypothetical protein